VVKSIVAETKAKQYQPIQVIRPVEDVDIKLEMTNEEEEELDAMMLDPFAQPFEPMDMLYDEPVYTAVLSTYTDP
jgi:hypothetical protein